MPRNIVLFLSLLLLACGSETASVQKTAIPTPEVVHVKEWVVYDYSPERPDCKVVKGFVENLGGKTLTYVTVNLVLRDKENRLLDTHTDIVHDDMSPGGTGEFSAFMCQPGADHVEIRKIEWR